MHPLEFHFAFNIDKSESIKEKLLNNGAKIFEEINLDDGSYLIVLRDPFGVPLQLCKRATSLA